MEVENECIFLNPEKNRPKSKMGGKNFQEEQKMSIIFYSFLPNPTTNDLKSQIYHYFDVYSFHHIKTIVSRLLREVSAICKSLKKL